MYQNYQKRWGATIRGGTTIRDNTVSFLNSPCYQGHVCESVFILITFYIRLPCSHHISILLPQEDTYNGDDMNDMSTDFTSRGMSNADGNMTYGSNAPSLNYGASPNYHPSYDGYASKSLFFLCLHVCLFH